MCAERVVRGGSAKPVRRSARRRRDARWTEKSRTHQNRPGNFADGEYGEMSAPLTYTTSFSTLHRVSRTRIMVERLQITISPELLMAVDEYRFATRRNSRSEAARRLLEAGIQAVGVVSVEQSVDTRRDGVGHAPLPSSS